MHITNNVYTGFREVPTTNKKLHFQCHVSFDIHPQKSDFIQINK